MATIQELLPTAVIFSIAQDQDTPSDGIITSQINYDGLGRKSQTWYTAPEGQIETCYTYDGKNRLASVSNPNNGACSTLLTAYTYDELDRKLTITAQDNSVTQYVYKGDPTKFANDTLEVEPPLPGQSNGNNRLEYADALGRLRGVTENATSWLGGSYGQTGQASYTTIYGYDALDSLTSVTQGAETRSFVYDSLKRLVQSSNPESGTFKFSYDTSGNLQTRTDPRLVPGTSTPFQTAYTYDGLNRLTGKTYNDGAVQSPYLPTPAVTLAYDNAIGNFSSAAPIGRLDQVQAGCFYYAWGYDVVGHVTESQESVPSNAFAASSTCPTSYNTASSTYPGINYDIFYAYNLTGAMTWLSYPSGRVVTTSYDTANRISQVQDIYNGTLSTHASSINYWPNRVIENMNIGHANSNGVNLVENTTLNSRLQVSNRNAQLGSVFPVQFSFTYGAAGKNNGNLTAQQIQTLAAPNPPPNVTIPALNLTQAYSYDAYDRIISAAETGGASEWTQNYLYDPFGNRAVQTGSYIPNPNGTPTAASQFTNNRWMGAGAAYDAAGNATAIPGTTNETFTYDAENRVNTANAMGTISYIYDGLGRRVGKTSSTFSTTYLLDAEGKVLVESTVPAGGTSYPVNAPVTGTEYLMGDHLGSTRLSLNNQQQVVRRYDFLPFGEEIVAGVGGRGADYEPSSYLYPTTPDDVLKKFTGKERDSETGLDYFGARYFSGAQGRFTSPDWSAKPEPVPYANLEDPQTLNLYGYVRGNPLAKVDGDGHCPPCIEILESPMVQEAAEQAASVTVGILAGAYIGTRESVQEGARAVADYIGAHPPQTASQQDREDLHNLFNPAKQSSSEKTPGPVKAKDAPGVTAGGQATDEHGNKVGPSGRNQVNGVDSSTKKGAKDAARNAGQGAPEKHPSPTKGDPHYHPTDADGKKKPNSTHYNY